MPLTAPIYLKWSFWIKLIVVFLVMWLQFLFRNDVAVAKENNQNYEHNCSMCQTGAAAADSGQEASVFH